MPIELNTNATISAGFSIIATSLAALFGNIPTFWLCALLFGSFLVVWAFLEILVKKIKIKIHSISPLNHIILIPMEIAAQKALDTLKNTKSASHINLSADNQQDLLNTYAHYIAHDKTLYAIEPPSKKIELIQRTNAQGATYIGRFHDNGKNWGLAGSPITHTNVMVKVNDLWSFIKNYKKNKMSNAALKSADGNTQCLDLQEPSNLRQQP